MNHQGATSKVHWLLTGWCLCGLIFRIQQRVALSDYIAVASLDRRQLTFFSPTGKMSVRLVRPIMVAVSTERKGDRRCGRA